MRNEAANQRLRNIRFLLIMTLLTFHKTVPYIFDFPFVLMVTSQIPSEYCSKNVDSVFLQQKVFLTSHNYQLTLAANFLTRCSNLCYCILQKYGVRMLNWILIYWNRRKITLLILLILSWIKQKVSQCCHSRRSWANIFKTCNLFEYPKVLATFRRTTRK